MRWIGSVLDECVFYFMDFILFLWILFYFCCKNRTFSEHRLSVILGKNSYWEQNLRRTSGIMFCSLLSIHEYKIYTRTSRQFGIVQVYLNAAFLGKIQGSGACRKGSQQSIFHLDYWEKSGEEWLSQWLQKDGAISPGGLVTSAVKCIFKIQFWTSTVQTWLLAQNIGIDNSSSAWVPSCQNKNGMKLYISGGSNHTSGQEKFSGAGSSKVSKLDQETSWQPLYLAQYSWNMLFSGAHN